MTGKDKLLEFLIHNKCPDNFSLTRVVLKCGDNSRCAECWKLALEEEYDD